MLHDRSSLGPELERQIDVRLEFVKEIVPSYANSQQLCHLKSLAALLAFLVLRLASVFEI